MYKNTHLAFLLFGLFALISVKGSAKTKFSSCSDEMFQSIESTDNLNFETLRHRLLVARKALHSVSLNKQQRVQVEQSFQTGAKKLNCVSNINSKTIHSALYIPTILDGTSLGELKTSFWQFQLNVQDSRVGVWNQKSRLATSNLSEWQELRQHLLNQSVQVNLKKITSKIAIIEFSRTKDQGLESVIVTYDVVEGLK
jgi:hypothetical protein